MSNLRAAIAALAIAATGCTSGPSATAGLVEVAVGQHIEIRAAGSPVLATLWVQRVEPVSCSQPGSLPPSRGHYLAVTVVLRTSRDYAPDWGWWMTSDDFTTIDSSGDESGRGLFTSCLPPDLLLEEDFYRPDSGYEGAVLLDTEETSGTLVYRPRNLAGDIVGWRWRF
ncbi:hypothetical protein ACFQV2_18005 [Actinokineospora soli]|uniref:DUF4352 domain-containing protein n=1 Tax=Actinokineospora soli TaxID=1048753 RepID=A0ABW2TMW2_9PSEU